MTRSPPEVKRQAPGDTLHGEQWLARRLGRFGQLTIFAGVTDPQIRKQRIRQAILDRGLDQVVCTSVNGKCLTYAAAFERLYREALQSTKPTREKPC